MPLVTLQEVKDYIGNIAVDADPVLNQLLTTTQNILEDQTDQTFADAVSVTDEPHDGSGTPRLYLDRPPISLSAAVKVGVDPADPDDTIAIADIVVDSAAWLLIHKNGGVFRHGFRNIFVSYSAAANLPAAAKSAVMEAVAYLFRRRGREHVSSETIGEFGNINMLRARLENLPVWRHAVASLKRHVFV